LDGGMSDEAAPEPQPEQASRPAHVEESVRTMADLHAEHYERMPALGRLLDALTARAGAPHFVIGLLVVMAAWVGLNLAMIAAGLKPLDPPPFGYLQTAGTAFALCMTCLILSTQRREDELSTRRQQMTLELSLLAEQKASKAIQLLEELRRDSPLVSNRRDEHAESLATPSDPRMIRDAIQETHAVLAPSNPATNG
jgi:uncharacterized membrane protein